MTSSQITIDSASVQAIVSKAIVESLSEETKTSVIEQAVEALVTSPRGTGYSSQAQPTPLQTAFNTAVTKAAYDVVREMVDEGDLKERIRTLVREKVVEALASGEGLLVDSIGNAVGETVKESLRKADRADF